MLMFLLSFFTPPFLFCFFFPSHTLSQLLEPDALTVCHQGASVPQRDIQLLSLPSPWALPLQPNCPTLPHIPPLLLLLVLFLLPPGSHRPTWTPSQPSPSMRGGGKCRGQWMWTPSLFSLRLLDNEPFMMCQL